MVEQNVANVTTGVRFPSPAPSQMISLNEVKELVRCRDVYHISSGSGFLIRMPFRSLTQLHGLVNVGRGYVFSHKELFEAPICLEVQYGESASNRLPTQKWTQYWSFNGQIHRADDRPAIISASSNSYQKWWYWGGVTHRENRMPFFEHGEGIEIEKVKDHESFEDYDAVRYQKLTHHYNNRRTVEVVYRNYGESPKMTAAQSIYIEYDFKDVGLWPFRTRIQGYVKPHDAPMKTMSIHQEYHMIRDPGAKPADTFASMWSNGSMDNDFLTDLDLFDDDPNCAVPVWRTHGNQLTAMAEYATFKENRP